METNLPLVSVPVITYNSSKTVIETLDSVSNQTYSDIELIVSDDCSTDNTVEVCREWVEKHKERFVRTKILVTERNTGVAANLNRAESVCKGGWVKPIAGDDLLLPNCIKDLVDCVGTHPKALIIIGQMQVMGGDEDFRNSFYKVLKRNFEQLSQLSHEELYERVLEGNGIPAPAVFYSKTLLDRYGKLNDERIVFIEDWPKWIKLLRDGFFPVFLDKEVVRYRLGGISGSVVWDSLALYKDKRRIFFYYQWDHFYNKDKEMLVEKTIEEECRIYQELLDAKKEVRRIRTSYAYRLGKVLLLPMKILRKLRSCESGEGVGW